MTRATASLARLGWALLVVVATVVMTRGLWATVHIEPTAEALAAERRGHLLVAVASALLVALAVLARVALAAPLLTPLALLAAVAVCVVLAASDAVAVLALVVAYPLVLAALVAAFWAPRG